MTDRVRILTVALEQDVRTDDVEALMESICMLRGVLNVTLGPPVSGNDWATEERVRRELKTKVYEALDAPKEKR